MRFFVLSQQYLELSKAEIVNLLNLKKTKSIGHILIADTTSKLYERLAYTKAVYEHLFTCTKKQFRKKLESFNWQKHYKVDFCVRKFGEGPLEPAIAEIVHSKLKNPLVNLENPQTRFDFYYVKDKVVAGKLIGINHEPFEQRRAHLRPALQPISLHPRLARALVNLAQAKNKVVDPFCGTGGILIEAGLLGLPVVGYDIDEKMLLMAEKNLKKYKIDNYRLTRKDATKLKAKIPVIVSDLPYAKMTKTQDLEKLYAEFLKFVKKNTKTAVLGLSDKVNLNKIFKNAKIKPKQTFKLHIHKSMDKIICVF